MSDQSVSVKELFDIAKKHFGESLLTVEVDETGIRFVRVDENNNELSTYFQRPLEDLTHAAIVGFLRDDKEPNYSEVIF